MRNKLLQALTSKKITALLTAVCLIFPPVFAQNSAAALPSAVQTIPEVSPKVSNNYLVPFNLGRVTDALYTGSDKIVINIQDLHSHEETQRNIESILSILDKKYGLENIYVEGVCGGVSTKWLSSLSDEKAKEKILNNLLASGKLTGGEYYSVKSGRENILKGIETEDIYSGNLKRLNEIYKKKSEIESYLPHMRYILGRTAEKYYTKENRKLNRIVDKNKKGEIGRYSYFYYLAKAAGKAGINLNDYGAVADFIKIIEIQSGLKPGTINNDISGLLKELKNEISYADYSNLTKKLSDKKTEMEFYGDLSSLAEGSGLLTSKHKNLIEFFDYLSRSRNLNPVSVVKDEKRLLWELNYRFSKSVFEREIYFLKYYMGYIEDYLSNKLAADDYEFFAVNMPRFKLLWRKYADIDNIMDIEAYFNLFDDFYKDNSERNRHFVKNMFGVMPKEAKPGIRLKSGIDHSEKVIEKSFTAKEVKVVVAGGFHTHGFSRLLQDNGIDYIVITPNITQETATAEKLYEKSFKEQTAPLFDSYQKPSIFAGANGKGALDADVLNPLLETDPQTAHSVLSEATGKKVNGFEQNGGDFVIKAEGEEPEVVPQNKDITSERNSLPDNKELKLSYRTFGKISAAYKAVREAQRAGKTAKTDISGLQKSVNKIKNRSVKRRLQAKLDGIRGIPGTYRREQNGEIVSVQMEALKDYLTKPEGKGFILDYVRQITDIYAKSNGLDSDKEDFDESKGDTARNYYRFDYNKNLFDALSSFELQKKHRKVLRNSLLKQAEKFYEDYFGVGVYDGSLDENAVQAEYQSARIAVDMLGKYGFGEDMDILIELSDKLMNIRTSLIGVETHKRNYLRAVNGNAGNLQDLEKKYGAASNYSLRSVYFQFSLMEAVAKIAVRARRFENKEQFEKAKAYILSVLNGSVFSSESVKYEGIYWVRHAAASVIEYYKLYDAGDLQDPLISALEEFASVESEGGAHEAEHMLVSANTESANTDTLSLERNVRQILQSVKQKRIARLEPDEFFESFKNAPVADRYVYVKALLANWEAKTLKEKNKILKNLTGLKDDAGTESVPGILFSFNPLLDILAGEIKKDSFRAVNDFVLAFAGQRLFKGKYDSYIATGYLAPGELKNLMADITSTLGNLKDTGKDKPDEDIYDFVTVAGGGIDPEFLKSFASWTGLDPNSIFAGNGTIDSGGSSGILIGTFLNAIGVPVAPPGDSASFVQKASPLHDVIKSFINARFHKGKEYKTMSSGIKRLREDVTNNANGDFLKKEFDTVFLPEEINKIAQAVDGAGINTESASVRNLLLIGFQLLNLGYGPGFINPGGVYAGSKEYAEFLKEGKILAAADLPEGNISLIFDSAGRLIFPEQDSTHMPRMLGVEPESIDNAGDMEFLYDDLPVKTPVRDIISKGRVILGGMSSFYTSYLCQIKIEEVAEGLKNAVENFNLSVYISNPTRDSETGSLSSLEIIETIERTAGRKFSEIHNVYINHIATKAYLDKKAEFQDAKVEHKNFKMRDIFAGRLGAYFGINTLDGEAREYLERQGVIIVDIYDSVRAETVLSRVSRAADIIQLRYDSEKISEALKTAKVKHTQSVFRDMVLRFDEAEQRRDWAEFSKRLKAFLEPAGAWDDAVKRAAVMYLLEYKAVPSIAENGSKIEFFDDAGNKIDWIFIDRTGKFVISEDAGRKIEEKQKSVVVFSDIDSTLAEREKDFPAGMKSEIIKFYLKGIRFIMMTGNNLSAVEKKMELLPEEIAGLIPEFYVESSVRVVPDGKGGWEKVSGAHNLTGQTRDGIKETVHEREMIFYYKFLDFIDKTESLFVRENGTVRVKDGVTVSGFMEVLLGSFQYGYDPAKYGLSGGAAEEAVIDAFAKKGIAVSDITEIADKISGLTYSRLQGIYEAIYDLYEKGKYNKVTLDDALKLISFVPDAYKINVDDMNSAAARITGFLGIGSIEELYERIAAGSAAEAEAVYDDIYLKAKNELSERDFFNVLDFIALLEEARLLSEAEPSYADEAYVNYLKKEVFDRREKYSTDFSGKYTMSPVRPSVIRKYVAGYYIEKIRERFGDNIISIIGGRGSIDFLNEEGTKQRPIKDALEAGVPADNIVFLGDEVFPSGNIDNVFIGVDTTVAAIEDDIFIIAEKDFEGRNVFNSLSAFKEKTFIDANVRIFGLLNRIFDSQISSFSAAIPVLRELRLRVDSKSLSQYFDSAEVTGDFAAVAEKIYGDIESGVYSEREKGALLSVMAVKRAVADITGGVFGFDSFLALQIACVKLAFSDKTSYTVIANPGDEDKIRLARYLADKGITVNLVFNGKGYLFKEAAARGETSGKLSYVLEERRGNLNVYGYYDSADGESMSDSEKLKSLLGHISNSDYSQNKIIDISDGSIIDVSSVEEIFSRKGTEKLTIGAGRESKSLFAEMLAKARLEIKKRSTNRQYVAVEVGSGDIAGLANAQTVQYEYDKGVDTFVADLSVTDSNPDAFRSLLRHAHDRAMRVEIQFKAKDTDELSAFADALESKFQNFGRIDGIRLDLSGMELNNDIMKALPHLRTAVNRQSLGASFAVEMYAESGSALYGQWQSLIDRLGIVRIKDVSKITSEDNMSKTIVKIAAEPAENTVFDVAGIIKNNPTSVQLPYNLLVEIRKNGGDGVIGRTWQLLVSALRASFEITPEYAFSSAVSKGRSIAENVIEDKDRLYELLLNIRNKQSDELSEEMNLVKDISNDKNMDVIKAEGLLTGILQEKEYGDYSGSKDFADENIKEVLMKALVEREILVRSGAGIENARANDEFINTGIAAAREAYSLNDIEAAINVLGNTDLSSDGLTVQDKAAVIAVLFELLPLAEQKRNIGNLDIRAVGDMSVYGALLRAA
ncbi:MAG: hypothetical protein LBR69_04695 [Endomicrobium sp.]|nr:hypothetical protein [Endomicrobium sp.]